MKIIKTLFIAAITVCTFTVAEAQIRLPPPPPHPGGRPPLPRIHLKTPPPPPRPGGPVVVSSRSSRSRSRVTVRRHYYYRNGVRHYRTY